MIPLGHTDRVRLLVGEAVDGSDAQIERSLNFGRVSIVSGKVPPLLHPEQHGQLSTEVAKPGQD